MCAHTETVEVANILKEMLEDIKTRREIIDKVCRLVLYCCSARARAFWPPLVHVCAL